ncbi:hypothetical protein BT96DRAFT_939961 [Gymnopus androsaceus JB14]|uniref:CCHC-type domain-containing protein n=1 Tax=Gymnopus androsaceus JB14 TaxID=1447944 RepID=A0A6A4HLT1_9AGAR|nr:hypothetical protein BT96DRAFT_939961 [Gymnopus androsaceus JB14]
MFFTGCGADYIRKIAAAVPTGKEAVDSKLVLIIFTRVHPDYQHYIADLDSSLAVWKKANFTHLHHNLDQPIAIYISQCDDLMKSLEGFGHRPSDTHHMFTLLASLNPAFYGVWKRIFNMSPNPTLKTVKDTLLVECVGNGNPAYDPDPLIKKEEAFAACGSYTPSYPPCSQASGSSLRAAYSSNSDKRFRWCSTVHNDQCHRCGHTGHIADQCVYNMPQAIKDWVITGAPKPGRYNDPPPEPAEEIGAHSATAACSARLEGAFATIMASQSSASPAPDPYEVEAAFKIVHESALPINDADSD